MVFLPLFCPFVEKHPVSACLVKTLWAPTAWALGCPLRTETFSRARSLTQGHIGGNRAGKQTQPAGRTPVYSTRGLRDEQERLGLLP